MNTAENMASERYRVGELILDVGANTLHKNGQEIDLPDLSFRLLVALVRRSPNVLSTRELMDEVWGDVIVADETVVQRVKLLRDALGDNNPASRYIATVRRRGYRLVATVTRVTDEAGGAGDGVPAASVTRRILREARRRGILHVAGLYVVAAWVILQVSEIAFPAWGIDDSMLRYVFIAALAGLPLALVVGWVFDFTPKGLVRTRPPTSDSGSAALRRTDYVVVGLLALALMGGTYGLLSMVISDRSATSTPVTESKSIAVLPFVNLGDDPDNEYFTDGLSEELIYKLSRVPGLRVAARTSSFFFKGRVDNASDIAARLGVTTLLEGSVRRSGDRLRISARLTDAVTGFDLWSQTYERTMADIFDVQQDISDAIVQSLSIEFGPEHSARSLGDLPTRNLDAYELYLQGRHLLNQRGTEGVLGSVEKFKQAVELDPEFARAWSALGAAYAVTPVWSRQTRPEVDSNARDAARRAISLNPTLGEPHAVLGGIAEETWEWDESQSEFDLALQLEPNNALIQTWYGLLLISTGRLAAGRVALLRASDLDPLSPLGNHALAFLYTLTGEDELAAKHLNFSTELGLKYWHTINLTGIGLVRKGRFDEAVRLHAAAREEFPGRLWPEPVLLAMADPQRLPEALDYLAERESEGALSGDAALLFYGFLGQLDRAYNVVLPAAENRRLRLENLWFPELKAFRADPRFQALIAMTGLIDYWNTYGWPDLCRPVDDKVVCD